MKTKWIEVITRAGKKVSKYSRVCSIHFLPTDYKYIINKAGDLQKKLVKGVIPSQKLGFNPLFEENQRYIFS